MGGENCVYLHVGGTSKLNLHLRDVSAYGRFLFSSGGFPFTTKSAKIKIQDDAQILFYKVPK